MVCLGNDMFPTAARYYKIHKAPCHSELPCDIYVSLAGSVERSNFYYLILCQFGTSVAFAIWMIIASFCKHVMNIFFCRSGKEVGRTEANWSVAMMTNIIPLWNRTFAQFISHPMGFDFWFISAWCWKAKDSVFKTLWTDCAALPVKTRVCIPRQREIVFNIGEFSLQVVVIIQHLRSVRWDDNSQRLTSMAPVRIADILFTEYPVQPAQANTFPKPGTSFKVIQRDNGYAAKCLASQIFKWFRIIRLHRVALLWRKVRRPFLFTQGGLIQYSKAVPA